MYELIASPLLDSYQVLRPGHPRGLDLTRQAYLHLRDTASAGGQVPTWLAACATSTWGLRLAGRRAGAVVLVREQARPGFGRASWEITLGCNYACGHCYLGDRPFGGLPWPDRQRLLQMLRDSGVLWLQLTGGEPLVDRLYPRVHAAAYELGMLISLSTNGSRLADPRVLDLLTTYRPHRVAVSVYGSTAQAYRTVTGGRGSYAAFVRGLTAAREAGLRLRLNIVVTRDNAHQLDSMRALAERWALPYAVYPHLSPTIHGGDQPLTVQAPRTRRSGRPFTGCRAGRDFFHLDPWGRGSICKIARNPAVEPLRDGPQALTRLGAIADRALRRGAGCAGCSVAAGCATCPPMAALYRTAQVPPHPDCPRPQKEEQQCP